jgi:glycosyltransferase involved in cell wall biosynthesis
MTGDVLRIITRLNVGGPARQALLLDRELPARGYRSQLIAGMEGPREGTLATPEDDLVRLRSLRRPLNPVEDLRALGDLRREIRAGRPDVVHTHTAKAGALGRLAARRARVPVVVHTFHGHVLEAYFSRPVARAFVEAERRLARGTDALIAVSAAVRDELLALGIGDRRRWRVIPLGLELDPLLSELPDVAPARAALGLPTDLPVVGIVGRLAPIKDHRTFLRAAARLAGQRPDVHFAVVGDGELRGELEPAFRASLGERVTFTGWVRDLPALYASLDVVALTSRNEGTPVSLIEAAAARRPVVATRVGGVADVVVDGRSGVLVPRGDDAALADAVEEIIGQPGRARAMGEAGRAHVSERFSARVLVDRIADLYEELLAAKRIPGRG